MSDVELASATRALFSAAKADAPSAAARAKIWNGVGGAAGAAAAAGACAGAATAQSALQPVAIASASSTKLVLMGALFGSVVTVGLALAIVRVRPSGPVDLPSGAPRLVSNWDVESAPPPMPLSLDVQHARAGSPASAITNRAALSPSSRAPAAWSRSVPHDKASARAAVSVAASPPVRVASEDSLMREAALVAEARGAIMRGDAASALRLLRAASQLGARGLEPEELSLSAHALRMLGREAEAAAIDSDLKMRYPDHALAR